MEANSTDTSAILKPSAAPAYQGAPWDQQEATRASRLRRRFTHTVHTHRQTHTNTFRTDTLFRKQPKAPHQQKKFITRHISYTVVTHCVARHYSELILCFLQLGHDTCLNQWHCKMPFSVNKNKCKLSLWSISSSVITNACCAATHYSYRQQLHFLVG